MSFINSTKTIRISFLNIGLLKLFRVTVSVLTTNAYINYA